MKKNIGSQLALYPAYEYLKTGEVVGKCLSFKNREII